MKTFHKNGAFKAVLAVALAARAFGTLAAEDAGYPHDFDAGPSIFAFGADSRDPATSRSDLGIGDVSAYPGLLDAQDSPAMPGTPRLAAPEPSESDRWAEQG